MNIFLKLLTIFVFIDYIQSRPLFYIYDWPVVNETRYGYTSLSNLADVYPPAGSKLDPKSSYDHNFRGNSGAGTAIDPSVGLYSTWQFSLFQMVFSRLKVSEHRTMDPNLATAFIVPFDPGTHSYIDHMTGKPRLASPHGWRAINLMNDISKDPVMWHNQGHDHFVFHSVTVYQMVGIGVKVFYMTICQNCTVITIETTPTFTAIAGRTRKYYYAAPYPSSFHYNEKITDTPWVRKPTDPKRTILALFIGSVKTSQAKSNKLRRLLQKQCLDEPSCVWQDTPHKCTGVLNQSSSLLLFRKTTFCLAPTGDSLTRKSVFDSLLTGCIPVIFARATITQYKWYFTSEEVDEVSVYISRQAVVDNGINAIEELKKISPEEIKKKQDKIEKIAPRLQYSIVPDGYGGIGAPGARGQVWGPPVPDAADVIIDKILDRKTIEPIKGFTDEDLAIQKARQKEIMETHEDYIGLVPKEKDDKKANVNKKIQKIIKKNSNLEEK